ncbi:TerB family tellurite resistance protein [Defluviimonas sp. SAOS-178_SWC]|uniref:tellurite resistance TerB family protein n=1 Tax=Defluviimonas sp. SAOS-178_SWC TaxID=3121287 RepID=UPI0032216F8E
MFGRLLSSLLTPQPDRLPEPDAQLALAALLVRLARADADYSEPERSRIDRVLSTRYGLSPFETAKLRAGAEALEAEAPDTVRFTRALKDAVPHEDRMSLMQALWSVALADNARDAEEDAVIRLVADLLGISDRDSALARQSVEKTRT